MRFDEPEEFAVWFLPLFPSENRIDASKASAELVRAFLPVRGREKDGRRLRPECPFDTTRRACGDRGETKGNTLLTDAESKREREFLERYLCALYARLKETRLHPQRRNYGVTLREWREMTREWLKLNRR